MKSLEFTPSDMIHPTLCSKLLKGIQIGASKQVYLQIIEKLIDNSEEGYILECTEIPFTTQRPNILVPILNRATIHVPNMPKAA